MYRLSIQTGRSFAVSKKAKLGRETLSGKPGAVQALSVFQDNWQQYG
jgi:hypothetical protein